ncbi:hypothetical protein D9M69_561130 [compost metagenome]
MRLPLISAPIVWSSVALATSAATRLPLAPGLFSTVTGWRRSFESGSAMARAARSGEAPAGKPTRMRTGLVGQAASPPAARWAHEAGVNSEVAMAAAPPSSRRRLVIFKTDSGGLEKSG